MAGKPSAFLVIHQKPHLEILSCLHIVFQPKSNLAILTKFTARTCEGQVSYREHNTLLLGGLQNLIINTRCDANVCCVGCHPRVPCSGLREELPAESYEDNPRSYDAYRPRCTHGAAAANTKRYPQPSGSESVSLWTQQHQLCLFCQHSEVIS